MTSRLAAADYSFPLLPWEQALRFAHDLGMSGIDISLFEGRSHLKPAEMLSHPTASGSFVRRTVQNNGMVVADVFSIPGKDFIDLCPNHPDASMRRRSRDYFKHLVEFAHACQSAHVSILPGVDFEDEGYSFSFALCAEELAWRSEVAKDAGVQFGVEAHVGSIISQPAQARCLLDAAPKLTLTLDPAHFIAQGFSQNEIDPLIKYTSHVHARCARPGRLQASLKENTIDFIDLLKKLALGGYDGWYVVEYVWIDWEHCNEVDILSETVLLRDLLQSALGYGG